MCQIIVDVGTAAHTLRHYHQRNRSSVATVRQTVVIFLATSTAWQRVATIAPESRNLPLLLVRLFKELLLRRNACQLSLSLLQLGHHRI